MKIVQDIPFLLQKLLIMDTCTYWFFFIHLSDLEKNWNLSIKMFDSTPNSQHNLNKAKKMKKQKNLNIAPKDVKNKWADNENSFFKMKKKNPAATFCVHIIILTLIDPTLSQKTTIFFIQQFICLTLVAKRNLIDPYSYKKKPKNP